MFKFNSNHIITGQIKQILNSFNLPSYKIYTAQHYKYFLDHGVESPELADGLYIKWDKIVEYKNGKWGKDVDTYGYNNMYLNHTKTFPIANNIYDSDTHEYLGEFLRFQRDYLGLDLMPLYNCFSNRVCSNLNISINARHPDTLVDTGKTMTTTIPAVVDGFGTVVVPESVCEVPAYECVPGKEYKIKRAFWTKNKDYIIYMLPIKFFKQYTLAIDCATGIEMCCGLYSQYLEELDDKQVFIGGQHNLPAVEMSQYISDNTYKKYSSLRFNNPELWTGIDITTFDKIVDKCVTNKPVTGTTFTPEQIREGYKQRLLDREHLLKLFIKIPVSQKTSITILEGDYTDFNNCKYGPEIVQVVYAHKVPVVGEDGQPVKDEKGEIVYETIPDIRNEIVWKKRQNHFITNYCTINYAEDPDNPELALPVELPEVEDRPFRPISPLQLLMFNTGDSYPFSDRLMEYLSGNVVTPWDESIDNIKRAQKVVELNNNKIEIYGAWDGKLRNIFYDYMMNGRPQGDQFTFDINHDTLGYVDKDVEKFYTAWNLEYVRDKDGHKIQVTEKVKDKNGNYMTDENNKFIERPLYRTVNAILVGDNTDILREVRSYILTAKDVGAMPLYKQRFVPQGTIGTIDIYSEEE